MLHERRKTLTYYYNDPEENCRRGDPAWHNNTIDVCLYYRHNAYRDYI